jgi:hypothetical protein
MAAAFGLFVVLFALATVADAADDVLSFAQQQSLPPARSRGA